MRAKNSIATRTRKRIRRLNFKRYRRDQSGVTAVEFAMVAPPFLFLLFAIIEVGLGFFGNIDLENAVDDVARSIRTGQAQSQQNAMTKTEFINRVCSRVVALRNCESKLKVDVRTFTDFSGITFPEPTYQDGDIQDNFGFDMGGAEEIVLLRVFYVWDLMAQIPGVGLSNFEDGNYLIQVTKAFRNEPF